MSEVLQQRAQQLELENRALRQHLKQAKRVAQQHEHTLSVLRKVKEALQSNESMHRSILDNAIDCIISMDVQGSILEFNSAAEKIFGYSESKILGKNLADVIIPPNLRAAHKQGLQQRISSLSTLEGFHRRVETTAMRSDGSEFPVELSIVAIPGVGKVFFSGFVRDLTSHHQLLQQLKQSLEGTIQVIAAAVEARDPYTAGHQLRVANLATAIGRSMQLSSAQLDSIHWGGMIHDIGKINLPAEILSKPTRLSNLEYSLIQEHSSVGYQILKRIDLPWPIADIVHQHHERMDGSGYPQGLHEEQICVEAAVVSVADVVEAMSSHRPYRPGLGIDKALAEIQHGRGHLYNAQVVDACTQLFNEKTFNFATFGARTAADSAVKRVT